MAEWIRRNGFEIGVSVLVLILALASLNLPSMVGVANNGDFGRVVGFLGIHYPTDTYDLRYWNYTIQYFPLGSS